MNKREIRTYYGKEDIEEDYDMFRKDWDYDRSYQGGKHKSGLILQKVVLDLSLKFRMPNVMEWKQKMQTEENLTIEETEKYLTMLKNQFVIINEKEPYQERVRTPEEKLKEMENDDAARIERLKKNGGTQEEIDDLSTILSKSRKKYYQQWKSEQR